LKSCISNFAPKNYLPPLYPTKLHEYSEDSIIYEKTMKMESHWNEFIENHQNNEIEKSIFNRNECFKLIHEINFESLKNKNSIQELFLVRFKSFN